MHNQLVFHRWLQPVAWVLKNCGFLLLTKLHRTLINVPRDAIWVQRDESHLLLPLIVSPNEEKSLVSMSKTRWRLTGATYLRGHKKILGSHTIHVWPTKISETCVNETVNKYLIVTPRSMIGWQTRITYVCTTLVGGVTLRTTVSQY